VALKTANLQIHYPFGNPSCYPGSGTTVTNLGLAGSAYNGTISADSIRAGTPAGTLPTYDSVQNGGIFKFYGDKGRISIPDGTVTKASTTVTKTIQMWVLWNSLTAPTGNQLTSSTVAPIIGKLSNNFGFDGYVGYSNNAGSLRLTLNASAEYIPATANGAITTGQWYFLTIQINTANVNDSIKFYKEDVQQTITPTKYSATWSTTETNPLWLGTGFRNFSAATYGGVLPGGMESFSGWIGDFLMYDVALTPQEIYDNWQATAYPKYYGPAGTQVKYYDGTTWQTSSAQKVWNGSAWVDWDAYRWDGTSWIAI
jgi:hypothetical protein